MTKYIFVSGGVCSSLGKGVAASSIGALLESRGFSVYMVKCDPYINMDAGTMTLNQHGEIYVTDDGVETDVDLGNYARFTKGKLSRENSITTGQVYEAVIRKERKGLYNGECVQVIPHITDEIKDRINLVAKNKKDTIEFIIIEIGGTVGDIESVPFLEAARQIINDSGKTNAISVHLTLIPVIGKNELKTKPTQHSVKSMQEMGIQPDILICRAPSILDNLTRDKISLFTNVDSEAVFTSPDFNPVYKGPIVFHGQKLDQVILKKLGVKANKANLTPWHSLINRFTLHETEKKSKNKKIFKIGIVGKYIKIEDAYKSLCEALFLASLECAVNIEYIKIDPSELENAKNADNILQCFDGIVISGELSDDNKQNAKKTGIGTDINGLLNTVAWARKNKIPYLGINLGMYIMVIDWMRNVLNSDVSFDTVLNKRETMRLGVNKILIKEGTRLYDAYVSCDPAEISIKNKKMQITERHRHRYEISDKHFINIKNSGLKLAAFNSDNSLLECIEWSPDKYSWGVGVQFHPEYKSKPMAAPPLFKNFVNVLANNKLCNGNNKKKK
jgi:CTP synthase